MVITVFLWGLSWPIGRWMVSEEFGPTIPPFIIVIIRYIIFILLLLIVTYLYEKNIGFEFFKENWLDLSVMGALSVTIYQFGYLYGEKYTAASDASLVVATSPIIVLFVAFFVIKEPITKIKILGSVIAFFGVVLIVGFSPNTHVKDRLLGDFLVFIAAIAYGSYTVLLKKLFNKHDKSISSFHMLTWVSITGLIFTIPVALLNDPEYFTDFNLYNKIEPRIWLGILYLAIFSSLIAYLMYTQGVKMIGAGRSSIFVNLVPVVGIAASTFIGEIIDPLIHATSFFLIFLGIRLVNRNKKVALQPKSEQSSHLEEE
jgi:drug/metabolite transporter (DMT)-like permease